MVKTIQGELIAKGKKFAIIASRFNDFITKRLLEAAIDTLVRHGAKESEIDLVWVPGSLEIALVADKMAKTKKYDSIICLGTIIRGETPHFDYVANQASRGISRVSQDTGVPTIFGVITADNIEQAIKRAGTKEGNKGKDAAITAIEMANLLGAIK